MIREPWRSVLTPPTTRLALVEAAIGDLPGLEACDREIRRGGETYTADTLEELGVETPEAELFLVVGSDAAAGLDTWKRSDDVRRLATTVVVDRGGRSGGRPPDGWDHVVVDVPLLEISSSDLRARFADGRPVEAMVPAPVVELVRAAGLYGSGR